MRHRKKVTNSERIQNKRSICMAVLEKLPSESQKAFPPCLRTACNAYRGSGGILFLGWLRASLCASLRSKSKLIWPGWCM